MIVYNITINVSWAIHEDWLRWMKQEYIPQILDTGCFFEYRILKLLEVNDEEGPTYAIQFHTMTTENYQRFVERYDKYLRQQSHQKWRDQVVSFSSLMEVLH